MKCLLILTGESFRYGGQTTRDRSNCLDATNKQKLASYSHLRLINYMKSKFDADTEIFINSYKLNDIHDEILLNWYKSYVIYSKLHNNIFPSEYAFIESTNRDIVSINLEKYDFILFVRMDLYIKEYFLERFTQIDNKIRYGHLDYNGGGICHNIIYVPKCFFNLINVPLHINFRNPHHGKNCVTKIIDSSNIDYFINSYHSLSTDLNWNPLYSQVGRGESHKRENVGERYINNTLVKIESDTEYDHLLHTDTIEQNLKLIESDTFIISR